MNIKKFGKRLVKINRLFETIQEDGEVSSIERDLLLSYLKEAYEYAIASEEEEAIAPSISKKQEIETPSVEQLTPKVTYTPTVTPPEVIQQITATEIDNTYVAPEQEELKSSVEYISPVVEAVVEPSQEYTSASTPVESIREVTSDENDALATIFQKESAQDLSSRLGMTAITDITKAMGINEKIFTIRELFGGDAEIFNMVINRLDKFTSYEEARDYLITGIAKDQNWGSDDKIKKAETFVKLVKRRYA